RRPIMRKPLTLLAASTALTVAIGVPAWSAMQTDRGSPSYAALFEAAAQPIPLLVASGDRDHDRQDRKRDRRSHHDDDHDDDDDDGGDDNCRSDAPNPAPAGNIAPPQNGIFGNGAPPQVRVN